MLGILPIDSLKSQYGFVPLDRKSNLVHHIKLKLRSHSVLQLDLPSQAFVLDLEVTMHMEKEEDATIIAIVITNIKITLHTSLKKVRSREPSLQGSPPSQLNGSRSSSWCREGKVNQYKQRKVNVRFKIGLLL